MRMASMDLDDAAFTIKQILEVDTMPNLDLPKEKMLLI